jgi:hypothetical protein
VSKPIPKAIATVVTLTVAAAALMAFTRGDDSKPSVPSAAIVPSISGTTAPRVSGHTPKPKPKAHSTQSTTEPAADTTTTTKRSTGASSSHSGTSHPATPTPSPSPSPSPTHAGLLGALYDALHPHP